MVYGRYNYSFHGVYKPTYNWGAPSCSSMILNLHVFSIAMFDDQRVSTMMRLLSYCPKQVSGCPASFLHWEFTKVHPFRLVLNVGNGWVAGGCWGLLGLLLLVLVDHSHPFPSFSTNKMNLMNSSWKSEVFIFPYANHGAGIFTYIWLGDFGLSGKCWYMCIFQHHGLRMGFVQDWSCTCFLSKIYTYRMVPPSYKLVYKPH